MTCPKCVRGRLLIERAVATLEEASEIETYCLSCGYRVPPAIPAWLREELDAAQRKGPVTRPGTHRGVRL